MYKQIPLFYACCGFGGWNGCGWNNCGSCNSQCGNNCACGVTTRTVYINTVTGPTGSTGTTGPTGPTGPEIPDIPMQTVLVASNGALTATDGPVPLTTSAVYPVGSTGITVAGSTATLAEPGLYEIIYNVTATGAGTGANSSLYVNDVQVPTTVRDLEDGPAGATYLVNTASPNTTVQLQLGEAAGITAGSANLFIKKYDLPTPTAVLYS